MKQYCYIVEASRLAMLQEASDEEKQVLPEHITYVHRLVSDGAGIFAGAVKTKDSQHFGMVIFHAEDDNAAKAIVRNDPAVAARIMRACLYPMRVSLWNAEALTLEDGLQHYFYKIRPVRPEMIAEGFTELESKTMGEHFMYLKGLTEQGIFAFAGPTLVADNSNFGTGLLRADNIESAWEIGSNDPAVMNRVMRLDILPFKVACYDPVFATP